MTWIKIAILSFEQEDCEVEQDNETGRIRVSMPMWTWHGVDMGVTGREHHRYFEFYNSFGDLVHHIDEVLIGKMRYDAVLVGTLSP